MNNLIHKVSSFTGIYADSRDVKKDSLFVAIKGTQVDGHDYIEHAIKNGASFIVCEHIPEHLSTAAATFVLVPDAAVALGELLSIFYGHPSRAMKLVGVTGTNGKTTIATLLYELFRKLGYKVGLISTIKILIDEEVLPTMHTTPDPITLHQLIARMKEAGCQYVFMEVSSHAISQKRIAGLLFEGGIFTNLTRDHLDYHLTVDNYLKAKKTFFDDLPRNAFALTNIDDRVGEVMLQNSPVTRRYTYALRSVADFKAQIIESQIDATELTINGRNLTVPFVGEFNVYNLLAVYATATGALGQDKEDVLVALSALHPVSGRFQTMRMKKGFMAIVDYAHTPDALVNVLMTIRKVLKAKGVGRILTVVGCGGNRDKGKRPLMAKEAVQLSDVLILTSDNPRFEEPDDIIQDMMDGLNDKQKEQTLCIVDRRQAIKTACFMAQKADVVLIAGKGHEDYQDVKGVKHPFDDREEVRQFDINL